MLSYLHYFLAILAGTELAFGSQPGQKVLTSQDIPDGQLITLDPSWFSDDTTNSTTILADGSDLNIVIPVPMSVDPPPAFEDYNSDITNQSLPALLQLFGVDSSKIPALVQEAIPLFYSSLTSMFAHGNESTSATQFNDPIRLADIGSWIDHVVTEARYLVAPFTTDHNCALFASALTPGFEGVANLFTSLNAGSVHAPTTNDQDFYLNPQYKSISHDDNISICYNSIFPPFFEALGAVDAVTMNTVIYVKDGVSSNSVTDPQFAHNTRILQHEFTHIKQYKALGYNRPAFGTKYLFQFCKATFDYWGILMEREAIANEGYMDKILLNAIGSQFLPIYNARGLISSLGLPTLNAFQDLGGGKYEMLFQFGVMDIVCTGSKLKAPSCI